MYEFPMNELQLDEPLLELIKKISGHPLYYAAYFQNATVVAACAYAISKKTSLFRALEMLDEEIIIPYFFPLPDDHPSYEPTSFVNVPLNKLMKDIPYGRELLYFASESLARLTVKFVTQGEDSPQAENETDNDTSYDN